MPVNLPPKIPVMRFRNLRGYVQQVSATDYQGVIKDDGNCWHSIEVNLDTNTVIVKYKDLWYGLGCPDPKRISNLPEESVMDLGPVEQFPDGNVSGLYNKGPTCLSNFNTGNITITMQDDSDGNPTDEGVIHVWGYSSPLKLCKP